ncbi:hypothetical protein A2U01_0108489, partial [Trifolium medium]|nr:hypothetical protein [Trifolium medium]
MAAEADDLPEEIWERIFNMLNGDVETL